MTPLSLAAALLPDLARRTELAATVSTRASGVSEPGAIKVSHAAQLLRALLHGATSQLPHDTAPIGVTPLFDPHASAASASERVRDALIHSGTFYEAHQARWVAGQFDLAQLRNEPQARLAAMPSAAQADVAHSATASANSGEPEARQTIHAALPAALAPQLDSQLHFLQHGELRWSGAAWTGQPAQWSITREHGGAHDDPSERVWQTKLRVCLPQLGELEAQLRIDARGVSLRLNGAAHAQPRLTQALPQLAQSFESAGIKLSQLTVACHE